MLKKILVAVTSLVLLNTAFSQSLPNIKNKTEYKKVRAQMINQGWTPVPQSRNEFTESVFTESGSAYPELFQCAPTGAMPCLFVFENNSGKTVAVVTQGEVVQRFVGFQY